MRFRLLLTLPGLSLHPDGVQPLELTLHHEHTLRVVIDGPQDGNATCEVHTEAEPPKKVVEAFKALAAGRLPAKSLPRDEWRRDHNYIAGDGTIQGNYVLPMYLMPQVLQEFGTRLWAEMGQAAADAIGVLRWRSRTLGPRHPFASRGLSWSFDGEDWHTMPTSTSLTISSDTRLEVTAPAAQDLQTLLSAGEREPLAHELFREAWGNRHENPRSALLIGMSALEIGIKNYISICVPDAQWLTENVPSPPLVPIMTHYLPTLRPPGKDSGVIDFDDDLIDVFRVAVKLRNELAHRGIDVPRDRVLMTLRAIRNVLWMLDSARGHAWATGYLTELDEDPSSGYLKL